MVITSRLVILRWLDHPHDPRGDRSVYLLLTDCYGGNVWVSWGLTVGSQVVLNGGISIMVLWCGWHPNDVHSAPSW